MQTKIFGSLKERVNLFFYGPELLRQVEQERDFWKEQSCIDQLTGLHNRRCYDEIIQREIDRVDRYNKHPLTLTIIDIDKFKDVNDTFGHPAGDYVLKELGAMLRQPQVLRSIDYPCRIGGEEFALIMPATSAEQAYFAAQRIRLEVKKHAFVFNGKEIPVTISAGIAECCHGTTPVRLLSTADSFLYQAKHGGRDQVCSPHLLEKFEATQKEETLVYAVG